MWSIHDDERKKDPRKRDWEGGRERGTNLNEIKELTEGFQTSKFNKDFTLLHEFYSQIVCGP